MDVRGTALLMMEHLGRLAENHGVLSALDEARVFVTGAPGHLGRQVCRYLKTL